MSERYEQEREALEAAVAEKEAALHAADSSKSDAVKQAQRALEDAKNGGGEAGTRKEQQSQIAQLKENRDRLWKLKEAEGKILSERSGYVSRILVRSGERTSDASALVLSDAAGEKLFQAVLPQEEKSYLVPGDKISVTFSNGGKTLSGILIEAVGELEDKSCQITAKISDPQATIGQTAEMQINKEIGRYACSIPLSALYQESNGDYVYLIEEQNTILGVELTVRKRKVRVLDKDASYAALEDDTFTEEERIVTESDQDLKDGMRVRYTEE